MAKAGTRLTVPIEVRARQPPSAPSGHGGGHPWKNASGHTGANGKRHMRLTHPAKPRKVSPKALSSTGRATR
ncbi:hypothetical protein ACGFWE_23260 [Streptomyces sp. NPDC048523]|uniref:hypothetical protein n=1 Tax=unclassified Streptomyces TaxID=2593676 RepID=UPI003327DCB5